MSRFDKIYRGRSRRIKSRKELLAAIKRPHWKYPRADNGDLPEGREEVSDAESAGTPFRVLPTMLGGI